MKDSITDINLIVGPVLRGIAYHSLKEETKENQSIIIKTGSIEALYQGFSRTLAIISDRCSAQDFYCFEQNWEAQGKELIQFSIYDMIRIMDGITDQEAEATAKRIADRFDEEEIDIRLFLDDAKYYIAIRRMITHFGCNAVSVSCRELCSLGIPQKKNFVSCIAISLLKEDGVSCGCGECCRKMDQNVL